MSKKEERSLEVFSTISLESKHYPSRLRNISDPPVILNVLTRLSKGELTRIWERKTIAVVGTRKMTAYGKEATERLVEGLVEAGLVIVSGMALGIDGVAHETCLKKKGTTIAVLGAGVDVVYPPEHEGLYKRILSSGGVIVSEQPLGRRVSRELFPARNRIISGLADGVLVVEGAIKSGSLITARLALDQGREVFAVPGPITSEVSEGTNYLISQGAGVALSSDSILERFTG